MWAAAEKVLPQEIQKGKRSQGGRLNNEFRRTLTGNLYVLKRVISSANFRENFAPLEVFFGISENG